MVIASQIMWLFFVYSCAGWILETILVIMVTGKLVKNADSWDPQPIY